MLRLHFFGVGDGDCIVVELPDGRVGLVDSSLRPGAGLSPAASLLEGKPLAFCCLTHAHADHYSGMLEVLKAANIPKSRQDESTFWYSLSDLDEVFEELFNPEIDGEDNDLSESERERELGSLLDLFEWVHDTCPDGFAECIMNVTHRRFQDVHFTLVGPSPPSWNRYRKYLARQRRRQLPVSTQYANRISMTILLTYGDRRIWLLGDLSGAPLRRLEKRVWAATPSGACASVQASVLKVPHHGAKNGWFPEIADRLTRCDPNDHIIFSANGSHHPQVDVFNAWRGTGKRILTTWAMDPAQPPGSFGGWASDAVNAVSEEIVDYVPRDVVVTIHSDGRIDREYQAVDRV